MFPLNHYVQNYVFSDRCGHTRYMSTCILCDSDQISCMQCSTTSESKKCTSCKHSFNERPIFDLKKVNIVDRSKTPAMNIQSKFTPEKISELQLFLLSVVKYLQLHPECKFLILDKYVFHTYSQTLSFKFFQDYINMLVITFAINNFETNCEIIKIFIALLSQYAMIITNCNCGVATCIGGASCISDKLCNCRGWAYCICPCKNYTSTTCNFDHTQYMDSCDCSNSCEYFQNLDTTPFESKLLQMISLYSGLNFNGINMMQRESNQYAEDIAQLEEFERSLLQEQAHLMGNLEIPVLIRGVSYQYVRCPCGLDIRKQHYRPIDCIIAKGTLSKSNGLLVEKLFLLQFLVQKGTINVYLASYILYTLFEKYVELDDRILNITYTDMLFVMIRLYANIE